MPPQPAPVHPLLGEHLPLLPAEGSLLHQRCLPHQPLPACSPGGYPPSSSSPRVRAGVGGMWSHSSPELLGARSPSAGSLCHVLPQAPWAQVLLCSGATLGPGSTCWDWEQVVWTLWTHASMPVTRAQASLTGLSEEAWKMQAAAREMPSDPRGSTQALHKAWGSQGPVLDAGAWPRGTRSPGEGGPGRVRGLQRPLGRLGGPGDVG